MVNGLHSPESMRTMTRLPLSILPAILVPLTLMIHVISIAQTINRLKPPAVAIGMSLPGVSL